MIGTRMAGIAVHVIAVGTDAGENGGGYQRIAAVMTGSAFQSLVDKMLGNNVVAVAVNAVARRNHRMVVISGMVAGMAGFTADIVTGHPKIDRRGDRRNCPAVTGVAGELEVKIIFIGINMDFTQIVAVTAAAVERHRRMVVFDMTRAQIDFIMYPNRLVFGLMTEGTVDRQVVVAPAINRINNILVSIGMTNGTIIGQSLNMLRHNAIPFMAGGTIRRHQSVFMNIIRRMISVNDRHPSHEQANRHK